MATPSRGHILRAHPTELGLFEKVYDEHLADVKRVSNAYTKKNSYAEINWKELDQRILDVLVDLRYRGDFTDSSRKLLHKHVVNNDFVKFKAEIAKKSNWPNVPQDRFERRKAYVESK